MTKYNPNKTGNHKGYPNRRSIRLKGYDYSQPGLYFITIVCQNRKISFGNIKNDKIILNDAGEMVKTEWLKISNRFKNTELHEYVIMPNHFHAILEIITVGATLVVAQNNAGSISARNNGVAQNNADSISTRNNGVAQNNAGSISARNNGVAQNNADSISTRNNGVAQNNAGSISARNNGVAQNNAGSISTRNNGVAQNNAGSISARNNTNNGQPQGIARTRNKTLGDIIGAFQSITTVEYIRGVKTKNWQPFDGKLWQRNYWEHIIRNEKSYNNISEYIINNPLNWDEDKLFVN